MAGIKVNNELCRGCGLCVKSCSNKAIEIIDKKAVINDSCTICGICVESCPFGALEIEKKAEKKDVSQYSGVWVFSEANMGKLLNVDFELLGKGRELADKRGCKLTALLLSHKSDSMAKELIYAGADEVLNCADEELHDHSQELCCAIISRLIESRKPEILLFGATAFGRAVAPRIAARIQTGLTADCTHLEIDDETGLLRQTRPAFGGNLMATIVCPNTRPQMATVRPGIMEALPRSTKRTGEIIKVPFPKVKRKIKIMDTAISAQVGSIADAQIIVVAGKGIGSKKNMKLVNEFASLIGASVGVSRPLVESGWSEYSHQVGQTGSTVAPKLLISFGVSGAVQHLAGISRAEKIIAVNTDPDAPIFGISHVKIVGDCIEVLKELIEMYKKV